MQTYIVYYLDQYDMYKLKQEIVQAIDIIQAGNIASVMNKQHIISIKLDSALGI